MLTLPGKVAEANYRAWSAYREAISASHVCEADQEYTHLMEVVQSGIDEIRDSISSNS
jgi:hypothetical protein